MRFRLRSRSQRETSATRDQILQLISGGRTGLVFELLGLPDSRDALTSGPVSPLSWFVYYGDVSDRHVAMSTSDHGCGWGDRMERKFVGDYLPLS